MDKREVKTYPQKYDSIDQLIEETISSNGEDLEKLMDWAKLTAESDSPLIKSSIPEAPKDEYSIILEKMKSRNIKPRLMSDFSVEEQEAYNCRTFAGTRFRLDEIAEGEFSEENVVQLSPLSAAKKKFPFNLPGAVGITAACFLMATVVIWFKPGIDAVGQKEYKYHFREREEGKDDIVLGNQGNYITDISYIEKIYDEIKEKLGIGILRLNYIPKNMYLSEVTIESGFAKLTFIYKDTFIYMFEVIYSVDNSGNRFSDREIFTTVKNEWMEIKVPVRRNELSTGQYEYNVYLEIDNAYYYLEGIMEENEFLNIVAGLSLEQ